MPLNAYILAMANEARRYAKSTGGASKSGNFMYN